MNTKSKIVIVVCGIVSVAFCLMQSCEVAKLKTELANQSQNAIAMTDSVRVVKTKNGELESARLSLVGEKNDLKKLSDDLYKELQKEKGTVRYISKLEVSYVHDTVPLTVSVSNTDSTYRLSVGTSDSCRVIQGTTQFYISKGKIFTPSFILEKDEMNLKLVTGLRESDKKLEIFVRSLCPNVTITNIEGATIDPNDPLIKPKNPLVTTRDGVIAACGILLGIILKAL